MSARRVAALLVVLAAAVGLWLLDEGRADAQGPFKVSDQITDATTVLGAPLSDSHRSAIADGIAKLYATQGVRLWVVFVDDFGGQSPKDWAQVTWAASGLGGGDVLMAVSVSDCQSELLYPPSWVGNVQQQVHQVWARIEPEIGRGLFVSAAADTAYGLASLPVALPSTNRPGAVPSPSPWGSTADLLTRLAVGALAGLVVAFGLARGRPRGHWAHHKAVGGSLMAAGAVASLARFPSSLAHRTLGMVLGVVALAVIAAAVWALIRFDLGALVRAGLIGGLGLAGVVIAVLVAPALAPLLLLGLAVWALWWWLRGRSVDGGNAKLHARVETVLRLNEKSGWSGKIRAGRDRATGLPWRSTTLPLSYSLEDSAKTFAAVCAEVLGGYWRPSVRGHSVIATLTPPDDPAVIRYKTVLADARMLGEDVAVRVHDDEIVAEFAGRRAGALAHGEERAGVERRFAELRPPGADQSWVFDWQLHNHCCRITRTAFPRKVPHDRLADQRGGIAVGVGERGQLLYWQIHTMPHAFVCGGTGSGKSTSLATKITEAVDYAVLLANFKGSATFERFADLPHVIGYARSFAENVAEIRYTETIMQCRYSHTTPPLGAPDPHIPILLIIDEVPEFFAKASDADKRSLLAVLERGREARIHVVLAAQNVTSRTVPPDFLSLCEHREQWGAKRPTDMRLVWGESMTVADSLVPAGVPGRGIVTGPDGAPTLCQGLFTPAQAGPLSRPDAALLDGLLAEVDRAVPQAYERVEFAEAAGVRPECSAPNVRHPLPPSVMGVRGGERTAEHPTEHPAEHPTEHPTEHPGERLLADEAEEFLRSVSGTERPDKRAAVLAAWRAGGLSVRACAKAAGVSVSTAHKWIKEYEENGSE